MGGEAKRRRIIREREERERLAAATAAPPPAFHDAVFPDEKYRVGVDRASGKDSTVTFTSTPHAPPRRRTGSALLAMLMVATVLGPGFEPPRDK